MKLEVIDELGISKTERDLVERSHTDMTAEINQTRVIADVYFAKKLEKAANDTIVSNERLAKANEKYAQGLLWLTGGLVVVGILNVVLPLFRG